MKRKAFARLGQRSGPVWLLDLDNTLHDASSDILPAINRAMTAWIADHLRIDESSASALRIAYWKSHGATLLGMIAHHAVDPHAFLRETHPLCELLPHVRPQHALAGVLRRLPGAKIVFSNAPRHYAEAVLRKTGLRGLLRQVVAIENMRFAGGFRPKPSVAMLAMLCARVGVSPKRCVLVEDSPGNLHSARRLGMRTVLVLEHLGSARAWRFLAGPGRRIDRRAQSARMLRRGHGGG